MSFKLAPVRVLSIGAIAMTLLVVPTAAAQASLLQLGGCSQQQVQTPFAPWLDFSPYAIAPGGTFETGAPNWRLSGGAQVIVGNEPWHVDGAGDSHSLALPQGSSATSAPACAAVTTPTLRFFAKSTGGLLLSALRVDVVFKTTLGLVDTLPVGVLPALGTWTPSLPYVLVVNNLALLSSGYGTVQFRFTPVGSASWQIDDVYVDPWGKG
jgi:hypothetical protein